MSFAEKFLALREDREPKLTQKELGAFLLLTQRKISRLEKGVCEPNLEDLRRICQFYKVSADYLLDLPADLPYPKR